MVMLPLEIRDGKNGTVILKEPWWGMTLKTQLRKRALLLFYGGQDLQDEFATLPETGEDKDYDMCVSRKISDVAIE